MPGFPPRGSRAGSPASAATCSSAGPGSGEAALSSARTGPSRRPPDSFLPRVSQPPRGREAGRGGVASPARVCVWQGEGAGWQTRRAFSRWEGSSGRGAGLGEAHVSVVAGVQGRSENVGPGGEAADAA